MKGGGMKNSERRSEEIRRNELKIKNVEESVML